MTDFNVGDTIVATGAAWDDLKGELGKVTALQNDRPDRPIVALARGEFSWGAWGAWGEYAVELVEAANVAQGEADEVPADAINPAHYQGFSNGAQVVDITEHLSFNRGSAVKYIARAGKKDGNSDIQDLLKAEWFIQRELCKLRVEVAQLAQA